MEIRPIAPAEHDALADVTVAAYRGPDAEALGDDEASLRDVAGRATGATVLVAVSGGRVVGGVTYVAGPESPYAEFDDPEAAGVRMLAVAPGLQGRGIGRALVLACLERARAQGRARVVLHSAEPMVAARRLYRALGCARRPDLDRLAGQVHLAAYVHALVDARPRARAYDDPVDFLDAAAPLLLPREPEHTVLVTTLARLARSPADERGDVLLLAVEQGREVVAAALRTPPRALLLSHAIPAPALDALVAHLVEALPGLTRVHGSVADAEGFASLWQEHRGGGSDVLMRQCLMSCEAVEPPRAVPGAPRAATAADRDLLAAWVEAFTAEAVPHEQAQVTAVDLVDRLVASDQGGLEVWEHAGRLVSMASYVTADLAALRSEGAPAGPAWTSPRIGLVYTPPEARRRGYASACVAALTGRLLAAGHARTLLFTDLANPTSNHIYAAIGYHQLGDFAELTLRAG